MKINLIHNTKSLQQLITGWHQSLFKLMSFTASSSKRDILASNAASYTTFKADERNVENWR